MNLMESIQIALSSILAHKLRSALTMLGIIIGVASIIAIVAIGKGGGESIKSNMSGNGNATLEIVFQQKNEEGSISTINMEQKGYFRQEDIFELKKIREVKNIITMNTSTERIFESDAMVNVNVIGITADYKDVEKIKIIKGTDLSDHDLTQGNNVVVIDEKTAEKLFETEKLDAVGKIIEIKGQPFQIIGIYKNSFDSLEMLIPLQIWPVLYGTDHIQSLKIQAKNTDELKVAGEKTTALLAERKTSDMDGEYIVQDFSSFLEVASKLTNIITMIIGSIAGISLLVGGIGVMNIMLVSVTERTREIGIRKALGATRGKILLQFLIESVMLTLLGGVTGIGIGVGTAHIISKFAKWPPLVSWEVVVGGMLFSMIIGIVFGLIPANKAAKLDPIEALRYE